MEHKCLRCGGVMHQHHAGNLCYQCQAKRFEEKYTDVEDLVDAGGYADILGLDSEEQLKRLARNGMLAPRIPGIRKWLWRKDDIDAWFKQKQQEETQARTKTREQAGNRVFRRVALGIASNLKICSKDPIICISLSDKIGDKVYGLESILGSTATGQIEPIKLVKVTKSTALNMLQRLPKKDFPELIDITDWADLTYDRISEDLIVRLEAYF